jgi:hypothetical protein
VITVDKKQMDNVEYSNNLSSITTNDKIRTCGIKSSIAMAKADLKDKNTLLSRKLGLNLRKETRTLRKVDQKYFASFEM